MKGTAVFGLLLSTLNRTYLSDVLKVYVGPGLGALTRVLKARGFRV